MVRRCRIRFKDGSTREFELLEWEEAKAAPCSEVITKAIAYSDLEHELRRHKGEIHHVECERKDLPPKWYESESEIKEIVLKAAKTLDYLMDRVFECTVELKGGK